MVSERNLCRHCGGTGTCQSVDPLSSCPACIDYYQQQLGGQTDLRLVPCAHCHGTGRSEGNEGFLLCVHCEGGGFCRPYGEKVGCDFCVEKHAAARSEANADKPLIQVACGICGGKGYVKTPTHLVKAAVSQSHPPLGMFRIAIAFIITFIIAMTGSLFVVWAVQADTKNRIQHGNIDEAIRFDSYITVHEDRTMTLEEIVILKSIQESAFFVERVYPALSVTLFNQTNSDFHPEEVYLDGESVKFQAEINGKRAIIQNPNLIVKPGIHTYAFIYKMHLPTAQSDGETTLNWSVSGSRWGFPAKQATMAVALPSNIDKQAVEVAGSVGPVFWFKRECLSTIDDSGNITFNAGQPLTKLDRFSMKVTW